jgi:hypothetical protein
MHCKSASTDTQYVAIEAIESLTQIKAGIAFWLAWVFVPP